MARTPRIEFYKAADGWRWRWVASNGRIQADSAESYSRRSDVVRGARAVTRALLTPALLPDEGEINIGNYGRTVRVRVLP